jgi:PTS system nitrogen regulatory IIA component
MEISDLVSPQAVLCGARAASKKQALQEIAHRAADAYGLEVRGVVEGLLAREKLGSTAMGNGVAIPHARVAGLEGIVAVFARLDRPVDFEAADGQGVDLIFALLAPQDAGADHLRALAKVSRLMRDASIRKKLRETDNEDALYALVTDVSTSRAA